MATRPERILNEFDHAFPLDSLRRVTRSLGGNPRQATTQRPAGTRHCTVGRARIKNRFSSGNRLAQANTGGAEDGV
jgi:hypothetical protein